MTHQQLSHRCSTCRDTYQSQGHVTTITEDTKSLRCNLCKTTKATERDSAHVSPSHLGCDQRPPFTRPPAHPATHPDTSSVTPLRQTYLSATTPSTFFRLAHPPPTTAKHHPPTPPTPRSNAHVQPPLTTAHPPHTLHHHHPHHLHHPHHPHRIRYLPHRHSAET